MNKSLLSAAVGAVLIELWGRIEPRQPSERFYRCGIEFGREWKKVKGVDAATKERLEQEQMLEITFDDPTVSLGIYQVEQIAEVAANLNAVLTGDNTEAGESQDDAETETAGSLESTSPAASATSTDQKPEPASGDAGESTDAKSAGAGTDNTETKTEQEPAADQKLAETPAVTTAAAKPVEAKASTAKPKPKATAKAK